MNADIHYLNVSIFFFSYQPAHDDELDLAIDQVVDFLGEVEDGWWKGRSKETGKVKLQTEMD